MQHSAAVAHEPDFPAHAEMIASALAAARGTTSPTSWLLLEIAASETPAAAVERMSTELARVETCVATVEDGRRVFEDAVSRALAVRATVTPEDLHALAELDAGIAVVQVTLARIDGELATLRKAIEYLELVRASLAAAATTAMDWSEPTARWRWAATRQLLDDCNSEHVPGISRVREAFDSASHAPSEEAAQTLERELVPALAEYTEKRGLWHRPDVAPTWATAFRPGARHAPDADRLGVQRPRSRTPQAPRRSSTSPPSPPEPEPASGPEPRPYLTSRQASDYLGFESVGAIRKAVFDGRLRSIGRRGGRGTHLFTRAELDRFAAGRPLAGMPEDRLGAPPAEGDAHGQVEEAVELLGSASETPRPGVLRWLLDTATAGARFDPEDGLEDGEDTAAAADLIAELSPPPIDTGALADAVAERVSSLLRAEPRASEPSTALIDAPEAARQLGISERAFRSRLQRGQVPRAAVVRTGRRLQFRPGDLVRRR